jgi:hypothetical protein
MSNGCEYHNRISVFSACVLFSVSHEYARKKKKKNNITLVLIKTTKKKKEKERDSGIVAKKWTEFEIHSCAYE